LKIFLSTLAFPGKLYKAISCFQTLFFEILK